MDKEFYALAKDSLTSFKESVSALIEGNNEKQVIFILNTSLFNKASDAYKKENYQEAFDYLKESFLSGGDDGDSTLFSLDYKNLDKAEKALEENDTSATINCLKNSFIKIKTFSDNHIRYETKRDLFNKLQKTLDNYNKTHAILPKKTTFSKKASVVLLAVSILLVSLFVINSVTQKPPRTKSLSVFTDLYENNDEFRYGQDAYNAKDYQKALEYFTKSLNDTADISEKSQVLYKIALSTEMSGNYPKAVSLYSDIINDTTLPEKTRGYALFALFKMTSGYPGKTEEIKQAINSSPVLQEITKSSTSTAYMRYLLLKNSVDIFPGLNPAKVYLASREANSLFINKKTLSKEEIDKRETLIHSLIDTFDVDVASLAQFTDEKAFVPDLYTERAAAAGYAFASGDDSYSEELINEYFRKALQASALSLGVEAHTRYVYAVYLANTFGKERKDQILSILSPLYENESYQKTIMVQSIIAERNGQVGYKNGLLKLASIDTGFKKFLLQNGWREGDFVVK